MSAASRQPCPMAVRSTGADPQVRGSRLVDKVLRATIEELARVGYAGLSVEEVASKAGVNKTTIYRRWQRKGDLVLCALIEKAHQQVIAPDCGSLEDDLIAMASSCVALMSSAEGMSIGRMLFSEALDPEVADLVRSMRREREAMWMAAIERAIARGELERGDDALVAIESIVGAIHHRLLMMQEPVDAAYVQRLVRLVLKGLLRRPV